ncbi:MAG TPA: TIGR00366 family protein [Bryobacteraceae bacterium]|nr:TIGR00366 family protein [Bryobacteraceae bacterium]
MTPQPRRATALERFANLMSRWVPDAITAGVILTLFTMGAALALGSRPPQAMEAYHQGLWMLLPFTMQMTLILLLSMALSTTPLFRRGIARLARIPNSRNQVIALAFVVCGVTSYLYWGLGYALNPIVAIYFAAAAERKNIAIDFPYLLAVTTAAQALWQYGLSSSGPLLVATQGHFLEKTIGVIPLSTTIWSPAALLHEAVFGAAAILASCLTMPKAARPISKFPESLALAKAVGAVVDDDPGNPGIAQRLERSPIVPLSLACVLACWLYYHFITRRLSLDINSLNTILLLLVLVLHRTVKRLSGALEQAAGRSWPVIVLYHLYAGVAGLIQFTAVGDKVVRLAASICTRATFPLITAMAGSLFACFIPSSGGQWAVQGFVTVKTAMAVGVSVQRGMLALGVGDHVGNFLTPFWYVVIAGIARVDFRTFFGYGVMFGAIWFVIGVVVFTFAPC